MKKIFSMSICLLMLMNCFTGFAIDSAENLASKVITEIDTTKHSFPEGSTVTISCNGEECTSAEHLYVDADDVSILIDGQYAVGMTCAKGNLIEHGDAIETSKGNLNQRIDTPNRLGIKNPVSGTTVPHSITVMTDDAISVDALYTTHIVDNFHGQCTIEYLKSDGVTWEQCGSVTAYWDSEVKVTQNEWPLTEGVTTKGIRLNFQLAYTPTFGWLTEIQYRKPSQKLPELTKNGGIKIDAENGFEEANMFDGSAETSFKADVTGIDENVFLDFTLSEQIAADTVRIASDDVQNVTLYGSIDNEKYFEIFSGAPDSEGYITLPNSELLTALKAELELTEGCSELEISEIEIYKMNEDSEFDSMIDFFNGKDTTPITDEDIAFVTEDIKNPLPETFGAYDVEWRSENSSIIDVETGEIERTYVKRTVCIYADFKRGGELYHTNTYMITLGDDGSLEANNKYLYNQDQELVNLSSKIVSSSVSDAIGKNPTNMGSVEALYDNSNKTSGFSTDNNNSWLAYAMGKPEFNAYTLPYTFQFDFSEETAINGIDIWEYRDRINTIDILVSSDGEEWHNAAENIDVRGNGNQGGVVEKNVRFPLVYAKHVRFVVKELRETNDGMVAIKLCELMFLNTQAAPSTESGSAYFAVDRDSDTYVEVQGSGSITLDFGKIEGFDAIKWVNAGADAKDYTVSVSNNASIWTQVATGTLPNNGAEITEIDLGTYAVARYVKLDIESVYTDESAKISELYILEDSPTNLYKEQKNLAKLLSNNKMYLLSSEELTLLTANELDGIPENIDYYSLTWDFSDAMMINPETKEVTHTDEDLAGKVRIKVRDTNIGKNIYNGEFDIVSKAAFSIDDYHIAATKDVLSTGSYNLGCPDGFLYNQDNTVLEFTIDSDSEGTAYINSDDELLRIEKSDDVVTVTYKNESKSVSSNSDVKVRLLLKKDSFEAYLDYDNTRYKGFISNGAYKSDNAEGVKELVSDSVELSDINFMLHKDCINEFLNQMEFSHLSNQSMYSVTENVSLPTEIIGLPVVWTTSNADVIAANGTVNTLCDPSYVTLTASVNVGGAANWSKNIYASVNMPNIISNGNISVNATSYQNNQITNVADGSILTSFITSYKNGYTVKVLFTEKMYFSQLALIENNENGKIEQFNIYVDGNLVYEGQEVAGFANCLLESAYGNEIKIQVVKSQGMTGFSEIGIHSELSDYQKAKLDVNSLGLNSRYANGTYTLPIIGENGSRLSYSSSEPIVSFVENADSVTMKVENKDYNENVKITVTAKCDNDTFSKSFAIVAEGEKKISHTPTGGGAGGSGGGGGSSSSGNISYAPDGITPSTIPVTDNKDELSGHWGEAEIRSLVNKGIVQGDGNSLNLGGKVTRAEFLTMLIRALNVQLSGNAPVFSDINSNDWFAQVIQTAYEQGWIEGYNNMASPNALITREEMAKITCCALKLTVDETLTTDYTDTESQSEWAKPYISALTATNILKGYEDGTFKPANNLKRDETMIVIYRILNIGG